MRAALLLVLCGCPFTPGVLPAGDASVSDGDVDSAVPDDVVIDDMPQKVTCLSKWMAGPTLSMPTRIVAVSTSGSEADPFVSSDELSMYFVRASDIWLSTRASTTAAWGDPVEVSALSSSANDSKTSVTEDGLTAFFNSSRSNGTGGNSDVWRGTRATTADMFDIDQMYLDSVNTSGEQWDPHISRDGLRLYLAPSGSPQTLAMASRANLTSNFSAPMTIMELDSNMVDNDPTLSADELLIVFASNRNGNRNLWYATRSSLTTPFGTPQLVPGINTNTDDGAHLSDDGCRLWFVSDRGGNDEIYVTEVQ